MQLYAYGKAQVQGNIQIHLVFGWDKIEVHPEQDQTVSKTHLKYICDNFKHCFYLSCTTYIHAYYFLMLSRFKATIAW